MNIPIQIGKRYIIVAENGEPVRGRVTHFDAKVEFGVVRLDWWDGDHGFWRRHVLAEDTEKPGLLKRLIGAHA